MKRSLNDGGNNTPPHKVPEPKRERPPRFNVPAAFNDGRVRVLLDQWYSEIAAVAENQRVIPKNSASARAASIRQAVGVSALGDVITERCLCLRGVREER